MYRLILLGVASCVGALVLGAATNDIAAATVSILDETFDNADWTQVVLQENFNAQNFTAAQQATGGMPDEYRRNHMFGDETTNNGGVGPAGATIGHFWTDVAWDPATDGEVDGVVYGADAVAFDDRPVGQTVPTGVIVSMGFLLRQAGVVYVRNPTVGVAGPDSVWRPLTFNATQPTQFTRFDGQSGNPDFSANGPPIEFGYYTQAGAFVPAINNLFGVDNFQVTITTPGPIVPELGGLPLSMLGILGASCRRLRRCG
jgi:hypothetical protein